MIPRISRLSTALFALLFLAAGLLAPRASRADDRIKVTTTLSGYAAIARYVGGDRVEVRHIVEGYQDPHFVRPKPSLANLLADADLFVSTGLDLELWVPSLVDLSRNPNIRSGQPGYVAAAQGVPMLEVPQVKSRSEGGVHIYGNPHILVGPQNAPIVARNIATGLAKVDPAHAAEYEQRARDFADEIAKRLYGEELVKLVGAPTLNRMLKDSDQLVAFLEEHDYQGKPLIDHLGGWLAEAMPMRDQKVIGYHKNWAYFNAVFGLKMVNYVEPKPAIPPSPQHVEEVVEQMKREDIHVVVAANYFPEERVRALANRVGAKVVIVPLDVGGVEGTDDYFSFMDHLVSQIAAAFE